MQDGIIKGTGNSRYLKSIGNFLTQYPTYQDFVAALVAGTLPIDLNGINETGWDRLGTALNKANLLSDETAAALGLPNTAVPDDALESIAGFMAGGSYLKRTLLNEYTYDGSATVQFSFNGLDLYKLYALVISTPSGQENQGLIMMGGGIENPTGTNVVGGSSQNYSADLRASASPLVVFILFSALSSTSVYANTLCVNGYRGIYFIRMGIHKQGNLGTSGYIQGAGIVGTNYKLYQLD